MKRQIGVNERGLRVGEDHQNAKLTNGEVDLLLALRDEGWSYLRLARKFDIGKSTARDICKGLRRCQTPVAYKTVRVPALGLGEIQP